MGFSWRLARVRGPPSRREPGRGSLRLRAGAKAAAAASGSARTSGSPARVCRLGGQGIKEEGVLALVAFLEEGGQVELGFPQLAAVAHR
jgi:hypothetical protein